MAAGGVAEDVELELVDEDEEEEGAQHATLRHAVLYLLPGGVLGGVHAAHAAGGEEGVEPEVCTGESRSLRT